MSRSRCSGSRKKISPSRQTTASKLAAPTGRLSPSAAFFDFVVDEIETLRPIITG